MPAVASYARRFQGPRPSKLDGCFLPPSWPSHKQHTTLALYRTPVLRGQWPARACLKRPPPGPANASFSPPLVGNAMPDRARGRIARNTLPPVWPVGLSSPWLLEVDGSGSGSGSGAAPHPASSWASRRPGGPAGRVISPCQCSLLSKRLG